MNDRNAFVQQLQQQLEVWKKQVDDFTTRTADMGVHNREEYKKHLATLEAHGQALKEQIARSQHASEQAWNDLKAKTEQAWEGMHEAAKSALDRFK